MKSEKWRHYLLRFYASLYVEYALEKNLLQFYGQHRVVHKK